MGNENSLSKENKNTEMINQTVSKLFSEEIDSSYRGVKTCINSQEEDSNKGKKINIKIK